MSHINVYYTYKYGLEKVFIEKQKPQMDLIKRIIEWLKSLFVAVEIPDEPEVHVEPETPPTEPDEPEVPAEPEPEDNDNNTQTEMKKYKYHILLDNGHASSTPGKRSPVLDDGRQFFEYEFNRDVVRRIAKRFDELGVPYEILVPEKDKDIALSTRAARANKFCEEYGTKNCIFLSIHSNAAGKGDKWMTAKGFCCYTSKGETASDPIAEIFMRKAEEVLDPLGYTIRKWSQKKYSWEDNFTVLVKTNCPAILTENLFYDNKNEVEFLLSDEGRDAIAEIHVRSILALEDE